MRQQAKVIRVLDNKAIVSVVRQSACGHDCSTCGGCGLSTEPIVAEALNEKNAKVGDIVIVETDTTAVIRIAAVVYFLPVALFFIVYIACKFFGARESFALLCGCAGFILSVIFAFRVNRKLDSDSKAITLKIISIVTGDH